MIYFLKIIVNLNLTLRELRNGAVYKTAFPLKGNTVIGNDIWIDQNFIVEGGYISFDWRQQFEKRYLQSIRFICLAMTEEYIEKYFKDIARYESVVEIRFVDAKCTVDSLKKDNRGIIEGFRRAGEHVTVIKDNYEKTVFSLLE